MLYHLGMPRWLTVRRQIFALSRVPRSWTAHAPAQTTTRHQNCRSIISRSEQPLQDSTRVTVPNFSVIAHEDEDYFRYTSGRWLYNELLRLEERSLPFNIHGLYEVAAKALNKTASDVTAFRKLAEGGFNRTFLITLTGGEEVIAKLPYPVAFPSRFTVASEAATLGLVKHYGVPVPAVLDYCITKANPVGAEYMIMEKARGEELGDRWFSLPDLDRAKVIGRLSVIEHTLFSMPFPASGSVFYKRDLNSSIQTEDIPNADFCIGPSVEQRWWHDRRDQLQLANQPYLTPEQYLRGGAEKELAWLRAYGHPRFPAQEYREFIDYQKADPLEHIALLEKYLRIIPFLAPAAPEHQYLLKPTIRHPDINPRNIFVDEDLQISSLIDWQHCSVVPLFLQAGVPDCFANFGDEESVQLKKPAMPENLSTLSESERQEEIERFRRRHLHFYYFGAAHKFNNDHYKALRLPSIALKQNLCSNASAPWSGNSIPLKTNLIEAIARWDTIASSRTGATVPCPIAFSEVEASECLRISDAQDNIDEKLDMLRGRIGISTDGWVPLDRFDYAAAENLKIKDEVLEGETEEEKDVVLRHWPFDDHAEDGLS